MTRVRLRFTKLGKVRFTSHRDVARLFERGIRRAGIPVAYSEGFSPRPRLHFGLALSTGYESMAEYLEVDLLPTANLALEEVPERLSASLPAGLDVVACGEVEPGARSLQESVTSCTWRLAVAGEPAVGVRRAVDDFLSATAVPIVIERKGRPYDVDVRPLVTDLVVEGEVADQTVLVTELLTRPRAVRPAELLLALSPGLDAGGVRRLHQWVSLDGARQEPLPVGATRAAHAEACAS